MTKNQISFIKSLYYSKKYLILLIGSALNKTYQNIEQILFSFKFLLQIYFGDLFKYFLVNAHYLSKFFLIK